MKKRIAFTIILTLILLLFQYSCSFASSLSSIISGADGFISAGTGESPISDDSLKTLSNNIYNILLILGTVIAVIIGAILGIQFMVGSVEQKSKIKEALIPYFAGCAVIFGAFGIWKLAVNIGSGLSSESTIAGESGTVYDENQVKLNWASEAESYMIAHPASDLHEKDNTTLTNWWIGLNYKYHNDQNNYYIQRVREASSGYDADE